MSCGANRSNGTLTSEALAHVTGEGPAARAHLLPDHLEHVGALGAEFAAAFGASEAGRAAGRLHDLGKFSPSFQHLIRDENGFEAHLDPGDAGPRDHSTAGAIAAVRSLGIEPNLRASIAAVIAGHHGGLDDLHRLKARLDKKERLDAAVKGGAPAELVSGTQASAPAWLPPAKDPEALRRLEFFTRMLFSSLCDADFLDTERFFDTDKSELRRGWPTFDELLPRLTSFMTSLEASAPATEVNRVRAQIRQACVEAAEWAPGLFTLTVPTGGGKTLAALEFALHHAKRHGLRRVVCGIPFTSIIEQNAEVWRRALGDDAVLEHHSALGEARETPRTRIAAENWDAPVVVTTTVQLFESLFARRTSQCRKLHRLARSVIVLDEVQSLPVGLLAPILDVLQTLVRDYGASVVLSTATQPAFKHRPSFPIGLEGTREIVPPGLDAFGRLKRVRMEWPRDPRPVEWSSLAEELARHQDVLAIVHRRKDARALVSQVDGLIGSEDTFHLSALMCPAHRSRVLEDVKARKGRGHAVRLVATQLVEAGVDLDFPLVYRAMGGLDSLAQAAGRCNREGRLTHLGILRVFVAPTDPPPGVPQSALGVTRLMLAQSAGQLDLNDPAIFERYFSLLYPTRSLDAHGIQAEREKLCYRAVAESFRMIEDDWSAPVVVPFEGADPLIDELAYAGASRERLRRLQRFTVNVAQRDLTRWLATGCAREIEGVNVIVPGAVPYHARFGLMPDAAGEHAAGELIIDG